MQGDEIKLEALKLAMRRDRSPAQVVEDARVLEAYILEAHGSSSVSGKRPKKSSSQNKDDNLSILD